MKITKTENRSGTLRHGRTKRDASTSCGSIAGGCCNLFTSQSGLQRWGFIGGGYNNIIKGAEYAAILGGTGNTVSHSYSAAFGKGVASVCGCTFHANNFAAQDMPSTGGGAPGSFYKTLISGVCVVAIV